MVAQIMYKKFAKGLPFNRQEKDWFRMGLVLIRARLQTSSIPHPEVPKLPKVYWMATQDI
jgi:transposase